MKKNFCTIIAFLLLFSPINIAFAAYDLTNLKEYEDGDIESGGKESWVTTGEINGNKAYCVDPGTPPQGDGSGCVPVKVTATNAAKNTAVFNNSCSDEETAYALRYANIGDMKTNAYNADTIQLYKDAFAKGKGVEANTAADKAIETAKAAIQSTNGKTPSFRTSGNRVFYENAPSNTGVESDCGSNCSGIPTAISGTGSFTVTYNGPVEYCVGDEITITIAFFTEDDSDPDPDNPTPNRCDNYDKPNKNKECLETTEYECGGSAGQRFVSCTKWSSNDVFDDNGNKTGSSDKMPDNLKTPTDSWKEPITNSGDYIGSVPVDVPCNGDCSGVICPDKEYWTHPLDDYPNGLENPLCTEVGKKVQLIDEYSSNMSDTNYIDCCVLDNDDHKAKTIIVDDPDYICGTSGVYCMEDYAINDHNGGSSSFYELVDTDKNGMVTAGTYFNLKSRYGLYDTAKYGCFATSSTDEMMNMIKNDLQNELNTHNVTKYVLHKDYDPTPYNIEKHDIKCIYSKLVDDKDPDTGEVTGPHYKYPSYIKYGCSSRNSSCCDSTYDGGNYNTWNPYGDYEVGSGFCDLHTYYKLYVPNSTDGLKLNWDYIGYEEVGTSTRVRCKTTASWYDETTSGGSFPSAKAKEKADYYINLYNNTCNTGLKDQLKNALTSADCAKGIEYSYYDGDQLLKGPLADYGEFNSSNSNVNTGEQQNFSCTGGKSCNTRATKKYVSVGDGVHSNAQLEDSNYHTVEATVVHKYEFEGINICTDYETGNRSYYKDCDAILENPSAAESVLKNTGWPVSYDTVYGRYWYDFVFSKVNDSCIFGKNYWGMLDKQSYSCEYAVNGCDQCEYICYDDGSGNCDYNRKCTNECQNKCLGAGCLYDGGIGLALNYQPISLINVEDAFAYLTNNYEGVINLSSKRNMAINSKPIVAKKLAIGDNVQSKNWNTAKGKKTILNIYNDGKGEEIYSREPQYSVTLNMSQIKAIQDYNAATDNYLNDSMTCFKGDDSGKYIVCASDFLSELETDSRFNGVEVKGALGEKSKKDKSKWTSAKDIPGVSIAPKSGTGPAWK